MENKTLVSLCIPTNGVTEWVVPVIQSIYKDKEVRLDSFEVIITDNGTNTEFESIVREYQKHYNNLIYAKTSVSGFLNQIESFRFAKGQLVKFINHRMPLVDGFLRELLLISQRYSETKPQIFFYKWHLKKYIRVF